MQPTDNVKIGAITIPVEVVSTPDAINKGLSRRKSLKASDGMLFLFDHNAIFRFWMRGMKFPLDIIWIDGNKRIVDISKNLKPAAPFSKAVFYSPRVEARSVLEVNAGFCDAHNISVGDHVELPTSL